MIKDLNLATLIVDKLRKIIDNPASELVFSNEFELLIAVMLSAQCTDKRVNMVTKELFARYNNPYDIANMDLSELEDIIKSCNYYHNKAKNIIETCKILVERFDGQVPNDHSDLLSLKGVGNKTANVIEAVAFKKQAFAVDTHIYRVSKRLGLSKAKNPTLCEKDLVKFFKDFDFGEVHHLLLLFGRYFCTAKNPKCDNCEMKDICKEIER